MFIFDVKRVSDESFCPPDILEKLIMPLITIRTRATESLDHTFVAKRNRDYELRRAFRGQSLVWVDWRTYTKVGWSLVSERVARHVGG